MRMTKTKPKLTLQKGEYNINIFSKIFQENKIITKDKSLTYGIKKGETARDIIKI